MGIGKPVSLEKASAVGSLTSTRFGSLFRSQLTASSTTFLVARLIEGKGGIGTPASLATVERSDSSTSSKSGLLFLSQFKASWIFFSFFSFGDIPFGILIPVSFSRASASGSSRSLGLGSLFLSHCTISSSIPAFSCAVILLGIGIPASLVIASVVGLSISPSSASLLRNQSIAFSANFFLFFDVIFLGRGRFVRLDRTCAV